MSERTTASFRVFLPTEGVWLSEAAPLVKYSVKHGVRLHYLHKESDVAELVMNQEKGGGEVKGGIGEAISPQVAFKVVFLYMYTFVKTYKLFDGPLDTISIGTLAKLRKAMKGEIIPMPFRTLADVHEYFKTLFATQFSTISFSAYPTPPEGLMKLLASATSILLSRPLAWGRDMERVVKMGQRGGVELNEWLLANVIQMYVLSTNIFQFVSPQCTRQSCEEV